MPDLLTGAIVIAILIVSVVLHEVAHGYIARQRGDRTAEMEGRLTLNPIPHIDPVGTLLLPALLWFFGMPIIGWAKPVPVRPGAMRHPRHDWMMVSLAGPATNMLLAFAAAGILAAGGDALPDLARQTLTLAGIINITLAAFNMLPLPPLDGSRVVMRFLPPQLLEAYLRLEGSVGIIILYILLFTGTLGRILWPIISTVAGRLGLL